MNNYAVAILDLSALLMMFLLSSMVLYVLMFFASLMVLYVLIYFVGRNKDE